MNDRGEKLALLRFGPFELDRAGGELRKGGILIKLQTQQLQLLALLAERAGEIVTREEIRRALWGDETFVDFDRSINLGVNKIREALGDDPQRPQFIETLPRKGYRFVAPVVESGNGLPAVATAVSRPRAIWRRWLVAAGIAVLTIALAATTMLSRKRKAKPIQSLAVLPLENLSPDPDQDYFASGMTDELITALARIGALRVIPRTSVIRYKGTKETATQIAAELGVDAVLEGTVTRNKDRIRITAQLIGTAPERHLWAQQYEGSLKDVLAIQDDVARGVAHEIQIKVSPEEMAVPDASRSANPEAYDAFLRGFNLHPSEENLIKMRDYYKLAIDKDPGYALAWAWLADTYNLMANMGVMSRQESIPLARAAAEKAAQLNSEILQPIAVLANIEQNYEWNWAAAERDYKRAIELKPKAGAMAHMGYATELAELGRRREAVEEAQRARDLAPLIYEPNLSVAYYYYIDREYDQADTQARKLIEWEPGLPFGYFIRGSVYLQTGRPRDAVAYLEKNAALSNRAVKELMYLGHALGITGAREDARKVLAEMQSLAQRRYVPPDYIAVVYEGLGERDRALQWFEKAYTERSISGSVLPDPRLDSIRSDPRFKRILRRMGLPQ